MNDQGSQAGARRGRQTTRQQRILLALTHARRGMEIHQLHELLGRSCSLRTVYRDLEQLQAAGYPLYDAEGKWHVTASDARGPTLPVPLTALLGLLLGEELLAPGGGTWLVEPVRELRRCLLATLTPEARAYFHELRRSAAATLFAPGDYSSHTAQLEAIYEATDGEQVLEILYAAPSKPPRWRKVEPYGVRYHAGRFYLEAFCRTARAARTFEVKRIAQARVLEEMFDRVAGFDLREHVAERFGVMGGEAAEVVFDLDAAVAHIVRERRLHPSQRVEECAGGVRVYLHVAGLPEVAAWLAGFGDKAQAIRPVELVQQVTQLHRSALLRYTRGPKRARAAPPAKRKAAGGRGD